MNIAMEQTEEYVHGQLKAKYGDCFIRGNNGAFVLAGVGGGEKRGEVSDCSMCGRFDQQQPSASCAWWLNKRLHNKPKLTVENAGRVCVFVSVCIVSLSRKFKHACPKICLTNNQPSLSILTPSSFLLCSSINTVLYISTQKQR